MRNTFRKFRDGFDRFVERSLLLDSIVQVLSGNADLSDIIILLDPVMSAIIDHFRKKNEYKA